MANAEPTQLHSVNVFAKNTCLHFARQTSFSATTTEHYHDFMECFLVVAGQGTHQVNSQGVPVQRGDLVLIRPGDRHFYLDADPQFELVNIAFTEELFAQLIRALGLGQHATQLLAQPLPPSVRLSPETMARLSTGLDANRTPIPSTGTPAELQLRVLVSSLLVELVTSTAFERSPTKTIPGWIEELHSQMQAPSNYLKGLTTMRRLACCTPEHLNREFRKHYGLTPTAFVNSLRLDHASRLLLQTGLGIQEVAMESGFENLSHFYHCFKKQFGQSPRQYRQGTRNAVIP